MKKNILHSLKVMLFALLASCSSYHFYAIQNQNVQINPYRTFAWLPYIKTGTAPVVSDIADETIKAQATTELESKGLHLSIKNPDLLVRYFVILNDKIKTFEQPEYTYQTGAIYMGRGLYRKGAPIFTF